MLFIKRVGNDFGTEGSRGIIEKATGANEGDSKDIEQSEKTAHSELDGTNCE